MENKPRSPAAERREMLQMLKAEKERLIAERSLSASPAKQQEASEEIAKDEALEPPTLPKPGEDGNHETTEMDNAQMEVVEDHAVEVSSDEENPIGKKDWYTVLCRKESEVEKLEAQLQRLTARLTEKREQLRSHRKEQAYCGREIEKAKQESQQLTEKLQKQRLEKQQLLNKKDLLKQRKQLLLKTIQNSRENVGEAKLLQQILSHQVDQLQVEKNTSRQQVKKLHEELTSLDQLAGELHSLLSKENKQRKALKTMISEKIVEHDAEMEEMTRRIEKREGVAEERRKLVEAQAELHKWQEDQQRMYVESLHLETIVQNREVETQELRRQLKALWAEHQELFVKTEEKKKKLYALEAKSREEENKKQYFGGLGGDPADRRGNAVSSGATKFSPRTRGTTGQLSSSQKMEIEQDDDRDTSDHLNGTTATRLIEQITAEGGTSLTHSAVKSKEHRWIDAMNQSVRSVRSSKALELGPPVSVRAGQHINSSQIGNDISPINISPFAGGGGSGSRRGQDQNSSLLGGSRNNKAG
ncbi:unnamed protein product [Amoebophrya sp. A120]|nr:unnamed protein product [Amoebophrya sp. A120]|eukprot:GSA120T00010352001.1